MKSKFFPLIKFYFSFEGRINRFSYWILGWLPLTGFVVLGLLIDLIKTGSPGTFYFLFGLLQFWLSLAILVKRLHDRNLSGLMILTGFIPIIGTIWLFIEIGILKGSRGSNRFGTGLDSTIFEETQRIEEKLFLSFYKSFFSFEGRIGRFSYWILGWWPLAGYVVLGLLIDLIRTGSPGTFYFLFVLLLFWPGLAILVKRYHDRGHSEILILIILIPIVLAVILSLGSILMMDLESRIWVDFSQILAVLSKIIVIIGIIGCVWFFIDISLLKGTEGDNRFGYGPQSPFYKAVRSNDVQGVKNLLAAGSKVDARDTIDWTPLHVAVEKCYLEITDILLAHGAPVNAKTKINSTALHLIAESGDKTLAEKILSQGADVNVRNYEQKTPLDLAIENNHSELVELFKNQGGIRKEIQDAPKKILVQHNLRKTSDIPTILRAQNIWKSYTLGQGKHEILKGANLQVRRGEFLAIMGASGSGKSTLLHILGLLDRPDKGKLIFEGQNVFEQSQSHQDKIRNKDIGFVFQFYHLLPELNVEENIVMPLLIGFSSIDWLRYRWWARERAKRLTLSVSLGNQAIQRPATLSGGERQRVAMARALVENPKLLLADEPTGNLDSQAGKVILEHLKRLNQQGQTIIMVTHDANVAKLADRTVRLQDGKVS